MPKFTSLPNTPTHTPVAVKMSNVTMMFAIIIIIIIIIIIEEAKYYSASPSW
jgi:hypothetical protein